MSGGMLGNLTEAAAVQESVGCDFGTALAIVKAANEYDLEAAAPADNVVYGVDFAAGRRIDHGQLA
jgi:hypothetical protein